MVTADVQTVGDVAQTNGDVVAQTIGDVAQTIGDVAEMMMSKLMDAAASVTWYTAAASVTCMLLSLILLCFHLVCC